MGDPGSPAVTLGGFAGGFVLLLVVVRAVRIKQKRKQEAKQTA